MYLFIEEILSKWKDVVHLSLNYDSLIIFKSSKPFLFSIHFWHHHSVLFMYFFSFFYIRLLLHKVRSKGKVRQTASVLIFLKDFQFVFFDYTYLMKFLWSRETSFSNNIFFFVENYGVGFFLIRVVIDNIYYMSEELYSEWTD